MCPSGVQPASSPGPGPGAEGGAQRERSGAPGDRVLLEELKGELSQTKLELETTLKAQHKHLKELDALRSDPQTHTHTPARRHAHTYTHSYTITFHTRTIEFTHTLTQSHFIYRPPMKLFIAAFYFYLDTLRNIKQLLIF